MIKLFLLSLIIIHCFAAPSGGKTFHLQLLHFSDIDGNDDEAMINVKNLSKLVAYFRQQRPDNTLLLSSGDNYTNGPRYRASDNGDMADVLGVPGPGRSYIALLNALGVQASVVGNHELDQGLEEFAKVISPEQGKNGAFFPGAKFPYLTANIDFMINKNTALLVSKGGQKINDVRSRLTTSALVEVGGETIGLVGATSPEFANITGGGSLVVIPPVGEFNIKTLAEVIQKEINLLGEKGVNKIVLISHMQTFSTDIALASHLKDVDIIVAGGSGTLLADDDDQLKKGSTPSYDYPFMGTSLITGEPVLLVNTSGDYRYLGRLSVDFDASGKIIEPDNLDDTTKGIYLSESAKLGNAPMDEVVKIVSALDAVIEKENNSVKALGYSKVFLDGRREKIRTEETNLGNLIADAFLDTARSIDPSIQIAMINGGGIRSEIGAGKITLLDVKNTLRFNNKLATVAVRAKELVSILEHAVSKSTGSIVNTDPPGKFSQVSGLYFSFDSKKKALAWLDTKSCYNKSNPTLGSVSRIREMGVNAPDGTVDILVKDGVLQGNPDRIFRLVITDFIANGGDAFPYPCLENPEFKLLGDEISIQDAFEQYLVKKFSSTPYDIPETEVTEDRRIRDTSRF